MKMKPLEFLMWLPLPQKIFFFLSMILFVLIAIFMPLAIFWEEAYVILVWLFGSFVLLGFLYLVYMLAIIFVFTGGKTRRERTLERWEKSKEFLEVDEKFELVQGEKIMIPLTPCYIKQSSGLYHATYPRDVIVTNMRILSGYLISVLFFEQKEIFGGTSLWHPKTGKIPQQTMGISLGSGNTIIKSISYGTDAGGDHIELKCDYAPYWMKLYHPKAKQVYELFSK